MIEVQEMNSNNQGTYEWMNWWMKNKTNYEIEMNEFIKSL